MPTPKKVEVKKSPKKVADKVCATVTFYDAAKMTPEGINEIIKWLRRVGVATKKMHKEYAKKYETHYLVAKK